MEYAVKFWEDEEMRELGESCLHEVGLTKEVAIEEARKLYSKHDYPAVEVEDDNGNCVFHISTDVPNGENYEV
jgi:hypothetical protein